MPELSKLQRRESDIYDRMTTPELSQDAARSLVVLGITHLRMGQPLRQSLAEIWAGMHGQTGLENAATVAMLGAYVHGGIDEDGLDHYYSQSK